MIAVTSLLAFLGMPRTGARSDAAAKIRKKNSSIIVSATAIRLRGAPVIDVASLEALIEIAKKYETMIVEVPVTDHVEFLLWDDGVVFRFIDVEEATAALSAPTPGTGDVPIPSPHA